MKFRTTLVASLGLVMAVSAQAAVVSVWTNIPDNTLVTVGQTVDVYFYAQDTVGTGIIGCDARVQYDASEIDVLMVVPNVGLYQTGSPPFGAPWPPGFNSFVPGSSGPVDDGAGMISYFGGAVQSGGVPIGPSSGPAAVIGLVQFQVLSGITGDNVTTISMLPQATSPSNTFGLSDGRGKDQGTVPLSFDLVVPEPTTMLVLGSGLVGLLGLRRRRSMK